MLNYLSRLLWQLSSLQVLFFSSLDRLVPQFILTANLCTVGVHYPFNTKKKKTILCSCKHSRRRPDKLAVYIVISARQVCETSPSLHTSYHFFLEIRSLLQTLHQLLVVVCVMCLSGFVGRRTYDYHIQN